MIWIPKQSNIYRNFIAYFQAHFSQKNHFPFQLAFVLVFINVPVSDTRATNKSSRHRMSSIETNSIQRQLPDTNLFTDSKALKRVFLSNRTVTCNDGSKAGFYLRKSQGSRRWVVFFEGGWHCYSIDSCKQRWMKLRHLMTSDKWPSTRNGELSHTS